MTRNYWIIAIVLTALVWAVSGWFYPSLPQSIPTHWNIHGKVDGYGDKRWAVFMTPLFTTGMLIFFALMPALSPKHFEVDSFRSTYLFIMVIIVALFAYIQMMILLTTWQDVSGGAKWFDANRALVGGLLVFFGLMGNVMGKVRKNFYIGIRVPWTLASERVWNDTHRLAAWLMVVGSVFGLIIIVTGLPMAIAIGSLIVSAIVPVVYSFFHYKALERRGAL